MLGAGNDIVVVDQRHGALIPPAADVLKRLGDPATGPGFDQLLWLGPASERKHAASYRVFNADGSEVEQCGNGVRCVVWMLAQESGAGTEFVLESPVGPITGRPLDGERVAVNMGVPQFDPVCVPFAAAAEAERYKLDVDGTVLDVAVLSMGNPHCVLDVDDVERAELARLGPRIETHPRFPSRTNVGFMEFIKPTHIALRVHERGVGETLACGTGACAAVVAGRRAARLAEEVRVDLPGGQLMVSWRGGDEPVWLTGTAQLISEGMIDL